MVVREIIVVKKPRDDTLQDKPVSFPKLENMHLDMMENKKKLKKNIPIILIKTPVGKEGGKDAKKAAKYSAAIISGVAAGNVASTLSTKVKSKKKQENFTPANVSKDTSKDTSKDASSAPTKVSTKGKKTIDIETANEEDEEEGNLMEDLGDSTDGRADGRAEEGRENEEEGPGLDAEEEDHESVSEKEKSSTPDPSGGSDGNTPDAIEEDDDPYAGLSPEERERKEKEEYIWRFKILKKKYKTRKDIQDYNEHDDLPTMKQTYERTLREIQLEDNCESYRMYLIGGFMLMEFVSNNWLGVDLTGFTAHQMTLMNKYDRMLIELGEKSYNSWGSNLPVEIRLIGFIILQAGIFYLGKIVAEKGGGTMAEIFKMFTGTPVPAASDAAAVAAEVDPQAPKKKMRGPSVKVADLKKKVQD